MKEEGKQVKPYDELDEVREDRCPSFEDALDGDDDDMYLDPGFSSWDDYYRYKFG